MNKQTELLEEKIAELANEILQLEGKLIDSPLIKKQLSAARSTLGEICQSLHQLDFKTLASKPTTHKKHK